MKIWKTNQNSKEYTALVDWPTTQTAITCFKNFENFSNSYTACFALPGVCASLELQKSLDNGVLVTGSNQVRNIAATNAKEKTKDVPISPRLNAKAPSFTTAQEPLSKQGETSPHVKNSLNKELDTTDAIKLQPNEDGRPSFGTDHRPLPLAGSVSKSQPSPPNLQQPINAHFVIPSNHFILQSPPAQIPPINQFYCSAVPGIRNQFPRNGHVIQRNIIPQYFQQHHVMNQRFFRPVGAPAIQYFPPPFISYPSRGSGTLPCAVVPIPHPPPNHFVSVGSNASVTFSGVPPNPDQPVCATENVFPGRNESGKLDNTGTENNENNTRPEGPEIVDTKNNGSFVDSPHGNNTIPPAHVVEWQGKNVNNILPTLALHHQKQIDEDPSCTPPQRSNNTFIFKSNWSSNKSTKRWSANKKSQNIHPILMTPEVVESNVETTTQKGLTKSYVMVNESAVVEPVSYTHLTLPTICSV